MAKSLITNFGSAAVVDSGSNPRFCAIAGSLTGFGTTEAQFQIPIRTPGTLKSFHFYIAGNTLDVSTATVVLRKNGADTALTKTIDAETGWQSVTADVSSAANDLWVVGVTIPAETGTHTLTISGTAIVFEPTDANVTMQIFASSGATPSLSTDSTSRYSMFGRIAHAAAESAAKYRVRTACTIKGLYGYVTSNARTTDTTLTVMKDGVAQSATVTWGSGVTAAQSDTTNEVAFTAGTDFDLKFTTSTGGGAIVVSVFSVEVVSANDTFPLVCGLNSGKALTTGLVRYSGFGDLTDETATENDAEIVAPFAFTLSELHTLVAANTNATNASETRLRLNGADSTLVVSVATAATGLKAEASPTTQSVAINDTLSFESDNPDPAGTITRNWIGMLATVSAAATGHPAGRRLGLCENTRPVEIGRQNVRVF